MKIFKYLSILSVIFFLLGGFLADMLRIKETLASSIGLPEPARLLCSANHKTAPVLRGLKINPQEPFKFEFIIDSKDAEKVKPDEIKKIVEYFFAALTVPEEDVWVNLSPYEQDKVMPDELALTELGKGLLKQDYILKQISSSKTYPRTDLGRTYWKTFSGQDISTDDMSKIWITPNTADFYEKDNSILIANADLAVMHEKDYLNNKTSRENTDVIENEKQKFLQDVLLPEINTEVNYGECFSELRQMYYSLILATWFKRKAKASLYRYYVNQNKVKGIEIEDKEIKSKVYSLYVKAFEKGAYDIIRKEKDADSGKTIMRRYFSGGISSSGLTEKMYRLDGFPSISDVIDGVSSTITVEADPVNNMLKQITNVEDSIEGRREEGTESGTEKKLEILKQQLLVQIKHDTLTDKTLETFADISADKIEQMKKTAPEIFELLEKYMIEKAEKPIERLTEQEADFKKLIDCYGGLLAKAERHKRIVRNSSLDPREEYFIKRFKATKIMLYIEDYLMLNPDVTYHSIMEEIRNDYGSLDVRAQAYVRLGIMQYLKERNRMKVLLSDMAAAQIQEEQMLTKEEIEADSKKKAFMQKLIGFVPVSVTFYFAPDTINLVLDTDSYEFLYRVKEDGDFVEDMADRLPVSGRLPESDSEGFWNKEENFSRSGYTTRGLITFEKGIILKERKIKEHEKNHKFFEFYGKREIDHVMKGDFLDTFLTLDKINTATEEDEKKRFIYQSIEKLKRMALIHYQNELSSHMIEYGSMADSGNFYRKYKRKLKALLTETADFLKDEETSAFISEQVEKQVKEIVISNLSNLEDLLLVISEFLVTSGEIKRETATVDIVVEKATRFVAKFVQTMPITRIKDLPNGIKRIKNLIAARQSSSSLGGIDFDLSSFALGESGDTISFNFTELDFEKLNTCDGLAYRILE